MQAGRFDQMITLQSEVNTRDATFSSPVPSWPDYATIAAEVSFKPVREPEPDAAGQKQSTLRVIFRAQFYPGVLPTMRILFESKYYRILDVAVVGRRRTLMINAAEWNEGRR